MLFKADLEIPFDKNAIVQQVKTQSHTNSNTTCNRSEPERVLIVLSSVSISARAAKTKCLFTNQNTPCQELQRQFIVSHIIYIHTRVENPLLRINLLFCVILFNLSFSLCVDNQARLHYVENSQVLNATEGNISCSSLFVFSNNMFSTGIHRIFQEGNQEELRFRW